MSTPSLLPSSWEVPQVFRDRLGDTAGRQRAMAADGHLLLVLHAPPAPGEEERKGRCFWRLPDGSWRSSEHGGEVRALRSHLEEYERLVDELERVEDAAEGPREYFQVIRRVSPLHRAASNLYHTLQQAREQFPQDRDLINLRDQAYEIQRRAELLYRLTKDALEFEAADHAERLAERSYEMSTSAHRLNLLVAAFFPVATLSAVFGMNLLHGYEEAPPPVAFLGVIAVGLLLGGVLLLLVGRRPPGRQRPVEGPASLDWQPLAEPRPSARLERAGARGRP